MIDWYTYARGTVRALFSLAIAFFFLLGLLVSSAQQQVMAQLDAGTSYSVARKVVSDSGQARSDLQAALATRKILQAEKRGLELRAADLDGALYASMASVDQIVESIQHSGLCARLNADGLPEGIARWGAVYGCYRDGTVPDGDKPDIQQLVDPANDPTKITERAKRLKFDLQSVELTLADSDARIKEAQELIAKSGRASDALMIVTLLDQSFVGWFGITHIPPALMQIVLCFLSGLFGALLITLVLLVYPNNDLSFTQTNSFWNRILLGGLIAVGVFVMIAGGVAVLGSSETILNGQSNFLSFCAIGMLAGGFSDRFAKWLSDNATILVSKTQPRPLPDAAVPTPADPEN
ncbi:MAG: hypothetical protein EOP58_08530 [Sphingomonadales bacterium]|nr:MAG: hypothetical protein EOP58_08530 [Sphingomonadales bacterium]